eukprot:NODE_11_length_54881_cov_1.430718.p46 type:complete len:103 gc:universal NODE_11_length_54881_cov_1.430718:3235-2927(-)
MPLKGTLLNIMRTSKLPEDAISISTCAFCQSPKIILPSCSALKSKMTNRIWLWVKAWYEGIKIEFISINLLLIAGSLNVLLRIGAFITSRGENILLLTVPAV